MFLDREIMTNGMAKWLHWMLIRLSKPVLSLQGVTIWTISKFLNFFTWKLANAKNTWDAHQHLFPPSEREGPKIWTLFLFAFHQSFPEWREVHAILTCDFKVIRICWHSQLKQYPQRAWAWLLMKPQMDLPHSEMWPGLVLTLKLNSTIGNLLDL